MMKRERLWEAVQKEIKYFNTQTDLLSASMSSLASARQSQIFSLSQQACSTYHLEHTILSQTNNSNSIINSINLTIKSIERCLEQFCESTVGDSVIFDSIRRYSHRISENCRNHLLSCSEVLKTLSSEPLLSETTAKSLLALIIHRPTIYEVETVIYPDISNLLKLNKTGV